MNTTYKVKNADDLCHKRPPGEEKTVQIYMGFQLFWEDEIIKLKSSEKLSRIRFFIEIKRGKVLRIHYNNHKSPTQKLLTLSCDISTKQHAIKSKKPCYYLKYKVNTTIVKTVHSVYAMGSISKEIK